MNNRLPVRKVLIADDYPDMAEMLAELIAVSSPFPVMVATVPDGAEALASAVADPPDCAILDIDMPRLDGFSCALAIRAELGSSVPLLIALTGDPAHRSSARARLAFDHFFVKPADVDALLGLIALERRR